MCGPHGAIFVGMRNAKNCGLQRFPPRFSGKPWEVRKCVLVSEFLPAAAERAMHEVISVKPRLQCRPQEVRGAKENCSQ